MLEPDLIELFVQPLNRLQIRYVISGSVASMLYGEPRVTHDIDLVVVLRLENLAQLSEAYAAPEFYLPPTEVMAIEIARERHGHFNVIHTSTSLKADFFTANRDELHAWAFRNVRHYSVNETSICLAPPEYVIVRKLEYYREGGSDKHLRDIRGILAVSGDQIDRSALQDWIARRCLDAEWRRVSA
jgi:hypothetical protein